MNVICRLEKLLKQHYLDSNVTSTDESETLQIVSKVRIKK